MILMAWVLKLLERYELFPEQTRRELGVIHDIHRARENGYLRDRSGLGSFLALLVTRFLLWFFVTGMVVFINHSEGLIDFARLSDMKMFSWALLYLVLFFFLEGATFFGVEGAPLTKLRPSPISLRSYFLYRYLRALEYRFSFIYRFVFFALLGLVFTDPGGFTFELFTYHYLKIATIIFILNTVTNGVLALSRDFTSTKRWSVVLKFSFYRVLSALLGCFIVLLFLDGLLGELAGVDGAFARSSHRLRTELPLLELPVFFHFMATRAVLDHSPAATLGFILLGLVLVCLVQYLLYLCQVERRLVGYRSPGYLAIHGYVFCLIWKERILQKLVKGKKQEPTQKELSLESGFAVFYSLGEAQELKGRKSWQAKELRDGAFFIPFFLLLYYSMGPFLVLFFVGFLSLTLTVAPGDPLGVKHPSPFVRLIPEKPGQVERIFFRHLSRIFTLRYALLYLPLVLAALIPLQNPFGPTRHETDTVTALVIGVLAPLLALSIYLYSAGSLGNRTQLATGKGSPPAVFMVGLLFLVFYPILVGVRFDVLENLFLSALLHLSGALLLLAAALLHFRGRLQEFLHCGSLPSSRDGGRRWESSRRLGKLVGILGLALTLLALTIPSEAVFPPGAFTKVDFRKGPVPEEVIIFLQEDYSFQNQDFYLEKNMVIAGNVSFSNCSLLFGSKEDGELGLYVLGSGSLELLSCRLDSNSSFAFEVYGGMNCRNTSISRVWRGAGGRDRDGGIELYSGKKHTLLFENSSFANCSEYGVLVSKADPIFRNCSFENIGEEALALFESEAQVLGCEFNKCGTGVGVFNSQPTISDSRFRNCGDAIDMDLFSYKEGGQNSVEKNDHTREDELLDFVSPAVLNILILAVALLWLSPWQFMVLFPGEVEEASEGARKTAKTKSLERKKGGET